MDTDQMTDYHELLATATSFLLIDWPSRDVPDTLARHGYRVASADGPRDDEYNAYELADGEVRVRPLDAAPHMIDIVYAHRPLAELERIVEQARALNARAVWLQSGSPQAREIVERAGLMYFDSPYLPDAIRGTAGL
ncbi:MAG TPA: CoA-binding protein [Candidatus Limnocylindrales bacterium]